MKKHIVYISLLSLVATPLIEACTFTILNNSPYEEIFISDKEHLADIVNRKTLMEVRSQATKQKSKNPEKPVEKAVRISKSMKKNAAKGQITGKWFDIYVPYGKIHPDSPSAQFKKAYRVSIHYCHDDNYITYKNVVAAAKSGTTHVTQIEQQRAKDGKRPRFDVVDFSNPEQAARAHTLIGSHDSDILQKNNATFKEAKPAKETKKSKAKKLKAKKTMPKATEFLEASKPESLQDQEFNEFVAYPGGNPEDFQGYIP